MKNITGDDLEKIRLNAGFKTRAAWARFLGVTPKTVKNWELGDTNIRREDYFDLMAKVAVLNGRANKFKTIMDEISELLGLKEEQNND